MSRTLRLSALPLAFAFLAACGDELGADRVEADPLYFANQVFDCDPETPAPSCPPFACKVDGTGRIFDCTEDRCAVDNDSTAFEYVGEPGRDLCVPEVCFVSAENTPPVCEAGCAPDDVTLYLLSFSCG